MLEKLTLTLCACLVLAVAPPVRAEYSGYVEIDGVLYPPTAPIWQPILKGLAKLGDPQHSTITAVPADEATTIAFTGNRLIAGYLKDADQLLPSFFVRQTDCSLTQLAVSGQGLRVAPGLVASVPNLQDYFHGVAGLGTTPNVFPKGCADSLLGASGRVGGYLGKGTDGSHLLFDAGMASSDLIVQRITPAFAVVTTTLATDVGGIVAVADLNGDGYNDIVATGIKAPGNGTPGIGVFIANPDGTFQAPVVYAVTGATQVTVDDVNADGHPDILVASLPDFNATSQLLTILVGNGAGGFTIGPSSATGAISTASIVTGDFRGTGRKDAIVGNVLMKSNGDGSFVAVAQALPFGAFGALATGDFNGDGKLDVVALPPNGPVAVYLGNGAGGFGAGSSYAALVGGEHLIVTDIDGDGRQDIVVGLGGNGMFLGDASALGMFQMLMGRGDGSFVAAPATTSIVGTAAAADFTGDGKVDLAGPAPLVNGSAPPALAVAPGDGSGRFGTPILTSIAIAPSVVASADLDKDGKMDVVAAGYYGPVGYKLVAAFGNGNGTFAREQNYSLPGPPVALATGDFDGDGRVDIAVATSTRLGGAGTSGVYVLMGQSNGTFAAPVQVDAAKSASLAVADLNGDGRSDLVVADFGNKNTNTPGTVHVYAGKAGGGFTASTPAALLAAGVPAFYFTAIAIADFNHDGHRDIVLGGFDSTFSAQLVALWGDGAGAFATGGSMAIDGGSQDPVTAIAAGDFDKDGLTDIAFALNDYAGIVFATADPAKFAQGTFAIAPQNVALLAADLNGDGTADIVAVGASSTASLVNGAASTLPGNANVASNPYGALAVTGATLNGTTISGFTSNTLIQLGSTPGAANSFAQIDFQGLSLGAGNTLTVRSGAAGQAVHLRNAGGVASVIGGAIVAQGGGGAAAPILVVQDANGLTVSAGGSIAGPAGLAVSTRATSTTGGALVNNGTIDGGIGLDVYSARITGGGDYRGNAILLSTFGNTNNPVNGNHFLSNGIKLSPSTGTDVALTINLYGATSQVLNVKANGNLTASLPSAWHSGSTLPLNNAPVPAGGTRPAGTPEPAYGGGSMIVQATGNLKLAGGVSRTTSLSPAASCSRRGAR